MIIEIKTEEFTMTIRPEQINYGVDVDVPLNISMGPEINAPEPTRGGSKKEHKCRLCGIIFKSWGKGKYRYCKDCDILSKEERGSEYAKQLRKAKARGIKLPPMPDETVWNPISKKTDDQLLDNDI